MTMSMHGATVFKIYLSYNKQGSNSILNVVLVLRIDRPKWKPYIALGYTFLTNTWNIPHGWMVLRTVQFLVKEQLYF